VPGHCLCNVLTYIASLCVLASYTGLGRARTNERGLVSAEETGWLVGNKTAQLSNVQHPLETYITTPQQYPFWNWGRAVVVFLVTVSPCILLGDGEARHLAAGSFLVAFLTQ
jgi:hypothetical protein